ncbi:MAG: aldose epimerase family protein [Thiolinea sp.]
MAGKPVTLPPAKDIPTTMTTLHAPLRSFGTAPDGSSVTLIHLQHAGTSARIMTWGASLQDLRIAGVEHSLVLGSPDFAAYLQKMWHFGAIAGPVANRIAHGRAPLDGRMIELERNDNQRNALHGGSLGCGVSNWTLEQADQRSCVLHFCNPAASPLPGRLELRAHYRLDDDGALLLEITASTDQLTWCSPAHHSYWNLDGSTTLAAHSLEIAADSYLPVDEHRIPLGAPQTVAGTRFDFRTPRPITLPGDSPLDHNFCLRRPGEWAAARDQTLQPVCQLRAAEVTLDIHSTEPGLQVYDAGRMDTHPAVGHQGAPYGAFAGVALEPQHWPDAPNHPEYPSIVLEPDQHCYQCSRFHAYVR